MTKIGIQKNLYKVALWLAVLLLAAGTLGGFCSGARADEIEQIAAPEFSVITEQISIGSFVEVQVQDPVPDAWYRGAIGWTDGESSGEYTGWYNMDGDGKILIPAVVDEAGNHAVLVDCGMDGMESNRTVAEITIAAGEGAQMNFSKQEAETGENILFALYAPNAAEMTVTVNETEDWTWENVWIWNNWGSDRDSGDWLRFDKSGEYTLNLYAKYTEEDEWEYTGVSKTIRINSEQYDLRAMIPATHEAGTDFVIAKPEKVTDIQIDIYDDTTYGSYVYKMSWTQNDGRWYNYINMETNDWMYEEDQHDNIAEIRVSGSLLQQNHTYHADLHMGGQGVEADNADDVKFTVAGGTDENLTLTVNGSEENQEVPVFVEFGVQAYAPGATAIRAYDGWSWHYAPGERLEENWNDGSEGTRSIYAQAYYGDAPWTAEGFDPESYDWAMFDWNQCGFDWDGVSNVIEMTYSSWGQLPAPQIEVLTSPAAEGSFARVQVNGREESAWYRGSIGVRDDNGDVQELWDWYDIDTDGIIRIPVIRNAGVYTLRVECGGISGFDGNWTDADLTVTDSAAYMDFSKTAAETGENIRFICYAPNAAEMAVTINEEDVWTGDVWSWENGWANGPWGWNPVTDDGMWFARSGEYTLKLYARENGHDWAYTGLSQTITVTSEKYDLRSMIPATLTAGEDFSIEKPEKVTDVRINVWDETAGGHIYTMNWTQDGGRWYNYINPDTNEWMYDEDQHDDAAEILLPADKLQKNHTYRVELHMGGQGVEADDADERFTVLDSRDSNLELTVTVQDESRDYLYVFENYRIRAHAEGASAIRIFDGWNWRYWNGDNVEDTWNDGSEGTRSIYAQAYYGDAPWSEEGFDWNNWDWGQWNWEQCGFEWSGVSNVIEMTYKSWGQMAKPEIEVLTNPAAIGGFAEVQVLNREEGAWYSGGIGWKADDGDVRDIWSWYDIDEDGIIRIPVNQDAGEYAVRVNCGGLTGQEGSCADADIAIVDYGAQMSFLKTEAETGENLRFSYYVPGAEEIMVTYKEPEGWTPEDSWDNVWTDTWGGDRADGDWLRFDRSGEYTLKLYGRENGHDWAYTGKSQIITVTSDIYDLRSMIPATMTAGTDFSIEIPQKVTDVQINVHDETADRQVYYMNWENWRSSNYNYYDTDTETWAAEDVELHDDEAQILLPAEYLKLNHTYNVNLHMSGRGVEADDVWDVRFTVIAGRDSKLTFAVDGSTAESDHLYVFEDYQVVAHADGATAIRAFDGWNWHYVPGHTLDETWSDGVPGTRSIYAQAYYGNAPWTEEDFKWEYWDWGQWNWEECGFEWGGISNIIEMTYDSWGQMDPPEIRVLTNPVIRGGFAEVEVLNPVEGAHYNASIGRKDGNGGIYDTWDWYDMDEDNIIRIPVKTEGTGDNAVAVDCGGITGKTGNRSSADITITDNGPTMTFSKTTPETGENIRFVCCAPGAEETAITVNETETWTGNYDVAWENGWIFGAFGGDNADGDWMRFDRSGDYLLKLYAWTENSGWVYTGVQQTITAVSEKYDLRSMIPETLEPGDDFRIEKPEKVTDVWISVNDNTAGTDIYWMNWDSERESDYNYFDTDTGTWAGGDGNLHDDEAQILIPAEYLKKNHTYSVNMRLGGQGVEADEVWDVKFTVTEPLDSNLTLTVEGSTADREVLVFEYYWVTAHAEGATAIRGFDGRDWHYAADDTLEDGWSDFEEGTRSIYAQAYYGDAPWTEEGFDWDSFDWDSWDWNNCGFDWGGLSNTIALTFRAVGTVGAYDFTNTDPITVTRGQSVTVTFTPSEHATQYWVDAFDGNGNGYDPQCKYEEGGTTVVFSTAGLPAGEYEIRGRTGNWEGWLMRESDSAVRLTVTEADIPQSGILLTFDKESVETREPFLVSVFAPGAERVKLCHLEEANVWWERDGESGACAHLLDDSGETTFLAYAMYNGEWTGPQQAVLAVTADGEIPAAEVTLRNYPILQGEDFRFRIEKPEAADAYEYWVEYIGSDGERTPIQNGPSMGSMNFTVETSDRTAGDIIILAVKTTGRGKDSVYRELWIPVVEECAVQETPTMVTPEMLKEIDEEAFVGIAAKVVQISDGVETIGTRAFAESALEQILIPASVTEIGDEAFDLGTAIFGQPGSYAQQWALEHGYAFYPAQ